MRFMDSSSLGILEWPLQVDLVQKGDTHLAHNYAILVHFHAESFENYLIQVLLGEDIH